MNEKIIQSNSHLTQFAFGLGVFGARNTRENYYPTKMMESDEKLNEITTTKSRFKRF